MIADLIANGNKYRLGPDWNLTMQFLASLTPVAEEKTYEIKGNDITAKVMSYETKSRDSAILETHRRHIDIHAVIAGRERMEWFPHEGLKIETPYNEEKDAEFYFHPPSSPLHVLANPTLFILFFPWDAHMPSLHPEGHPESVKKVVIKLKSELLL